MIAPRCASGECIRRNDQSAIRPRRQLRDFAFDLRVRADGGAHEYRREDAFICGERL
jgi:hypothetical protein